MRPQACKKAQQDRLEIVNYLELDHREEMMRLVEQGLRAENKWLHCKYLYDQRGSELFDQICRAPEYYPTRTEKALLERHAREIMDFFALNGGDLVEMGSGSNHKIRRLLDQFSPRAGASLRYVPFDISQSALEEAARELLDIYPGLEVMGIVGDYTRHLDALPPGRKLVVFLGSTLGNFGEAQGLKLLKGVAEALNPRDRFVLGLDMVKPVEVLEAAYNDAQGVTASFIKNILAHLNRELGADFPLEHFEHHAFFNPARECMEMHLRARRDLRCRVADLELELSLDRGETIHVEIARKFTPQGAREMFRQAGLRPTRWFSDQRGWFSLVELAKAG
ncbi:MAG: L-histidine N(alpha)-methyltransferase [Desulfarculaceae bacterium]|nr:L-histidine N(alpha)-methyltransferase [Desulfarculaceae bacterium]MCF8074330.1 L-histidine N(alpha)-methyltransferase [Desulfarculaceae bacterium]MCF8103804.1 L-histidine N(alpha)-methyltransferase [Desulfarculaceae bacterium]MCF8117812.1 L-histidine N(alpha)-methyltransferase [Desulfarculaceae bacterium]